MVIPADNTEEQLALQLIEKTGVNLFLTGRADLLDAIDDVLRR